MSHAAYDVARAIRERTCISAAVAADASPPFVAVRDFVASDIRHRNDCAKYAAMRDEPDALRQFQRFQTTTCDCGLDELREMFREDDDR